jgi:hypothetical protein
MNTSKTKKTIKRRDALKVLAATGAGLAGATLLPGKWDKPAMQVGVLPVHAQSSVCNAEVEYVSEGPCEVFPNVACGNFDYIGQFSYTPVFLVPSGLDVDICEDNVASGFVAGAPGTIYVLINSEDLACQGARIITITFEGGCVGVWEAIPNALNQSGSRFR